MAERDPDGNLAELYSAAVEGRAADLQSRSWFADGVVLALRRGISIDTALGLAGPGIPSMRRRALMAKRDAHLVDAARSIVLDTRLSQWEAATRLGPLLRRFEADTWPRVRSLNEPPASWDAWRRHAFHARATGIELPKSRSALYDLLQKAGGCFQESKRRTMLANLIDIEP